MKEQQLIHFWIELLSRNGLFYYSQTSLLFITDEAKLETEKDVMEKRLKV